MNRITVVAYLLCAFLIACAQTTEKTTQQVTTEDINIVMQRHTAELMAIPGVTGLAISELDDKTPCIWVLVLEESEELSKTLPESLEGHPVRIVVSGEIKPLEGP